MSRSLLALLALLVLHVFYVRPLTRNDRSLRDEAEQLSGQIHREKFLLRRREEIRESIGEGSLLSAQNSQMLYPADINSSSALGQLEQRIRDFAKEEGLTWGHSRWGEPEATEADYVRLPLSIALQGGAVRTAGFFSRLAQARPAVVVQSGRVNAIRDTKLSLNLVVVAFQATDAAGLPSPADRATAKRSPPGKAAPPAAEDTSPNAPREWPDSPPPGWPADEPWPPKIAPGSPPR
jgi:Tfp pilus assembly protein PilO